MSNCCHCEESGLRRDDVAIPDDRGHQLRRDVFLLQSKGDLSDRINRIYRILLPLPWGESKEVDHCVALDDNRLRRLFSQSPKRPVSLSNILNTVYCLLATWVYTTSPLYNNTSLRDFRVCEPQLCSQARSVRNTFRTSRLRSRSV